MKPKAKENPRYLLRQAKIEIERLKKENKRLRIIIDCRGGAK